MSVSAKLQATLFTPSGAGAIAVVRVGGVGADALVDSLFQSASGRRLTDAAAGRLRYGRLIEGGETLDDVIACVVSCESPCVVDLCMHGGVRVVERVLSALESRGALIDYSARGATVAPGPRDRGIDQTGHIWPTANAIEYEVDSTLESAKTERAVRFLAAQRRLLPARLVELDALLSSDARRVRDDIRSLMSAYDAVRRLIDGATVVIVGPPNSGKSTLFNRLVGRDAALVSPMAGTTRDWVSATIELDGVPVTLVDTAGDRVTPDELEEQAIREGRTRRAGADVILHVEDVSNRDAAAVREGTRQPGSRRDREEPARSQVLSVFNKIDLLEARRPFPTAVPSVPMDSAPCHVSALSGLGTDELLGALSRVLATNQPSAESPGFFTDRHQAIASEVLLLPITDTDRLHALIANLLGVARGNGETSCL